MAPKNKYAKRSRISEGRFRQFIKLFALDLQAGQIASGTRLNRNTVNRYLRSIRERIAEHCEDQSPLADEVKEDESNFSAKIGKGVRERNVIGKSVVFGIIERNGFVYTQIVPSMSRKTLKAIIRRRVEPDNVFHSDTWKCYDGLMDLGYKKHYRVRHDDNEYAMDNSPIHGIESFWGYAKTRLARFRGIHKSTFYLHLKECEFRFNNRKNNLYLLLLKIIRDNPLF